MAKRAYARRYAQAVFEIALEKKALDEWQTNLGKVAGLLEDAELVAFLESPKFRFDEKVRLLSENLEGVSPLVLNLVNLLITRGKLDIIGDIIDEYQRLWNSHRGIEQAQVLTAVPLDEDGKQSLTELLGRVVGKKVVLETEVDSGLVGGVIIRVGGKLLDGSTRSKLAALKRELAGAVS